MFKLVLELVKYYEREEESDYEVMRTGVQTII